MGKKIFFLFSFFVFITGIVFADTIILKDGTQINGTIVEQTKESVKIDKSGYAISYFADEISSINGKVFGETVGVEKITTTSNGKSVTGIGYEKNKLMLDAILKYIGIIFIVLIIFYIYSSICLQFIAKKTNQSPIFLAWIPIANLFLMCKIAQVSYWWLIVFLIGAIPFLNSIAIIIHLVVVGFIWYKIALQRNKPGWIGAITIIPIVGLFTMGYLAFSE